MASQIRVGVVLSYIVLGLNTLVGIGFTPYMLRMLGQSEFGLYSLVASVIAYLTILDLGFGNAIIRYTAKYRAEGKEDQLKSMYGMFLILYSIIGVVTFLIGLILYNNTYSLFGDTMTADEISKAQTMILIMVFNLAITFPFSIYSSIITAYEKFIFQKGIQIVRIILNTITMIVILEFGYRAIGMVVVLSVFNILSLLANFVFCKTIIKVKIEFQRFKWGFLREVSIYSFYIFLNVIMDKIYWSTGQFVLGAFVGTTAIAVFAVAIQIQKLYMQFSLAISGVFLPRVTALTTKEHSDNEISELFIKTGRIQYIVMAYILSNFIVFGKQFVLIWAGSEYGDAYYIALLFLIPLTVPLIQNLGITILQARNQMRFRSILYVVIAVSSLFFQIPLAKEFGAIGSAIGVSFALIVGHIIIMNFYYYKKQSINIIKFWRQIGRISISPIIIAAITFFALKLFPVNNIFGFFILIVIYTILYFPFLWLTMYECDKNLIKSIVLSVLKTNKFKQP